MWPSQPSTTDAASFWGSVAPSFAPSCSRSVVRDAPQKSAPSRKPSPSAAVKDEMLCGAAILFDIWHRPQFKDPRDAGREIMIRRTALDDFFRRLKAGTATVKLLMNHNWDFSLCSTADGSLKLWRTEFALMFRVESQTQAGRGAILAARSATDARQVSAASEITKSVGWEGRSVTVLELDLKELSILPRGACPGTWAAIL